jgi:D-alanine-D-alanine ligase
MNKAKCQEVLKHYQLNIPQYLMLASQPDFDELDKVISETINYPVVIKPNESGSSVGVSIIKDKNGLNEAVTAAFNEDRTVMIQKYIAGRELSCPVMGNSADNELIAFPVAEIVVHEQQFYDYQAKYFSAATEHLCPAPLSKELTAEIQKQSKVAHLALGCDGLTRSDFILRDDNKLYFLEINTIPGQTPASISPHCAKAMGINFTEFIERQLELALRKTKS